MKQFIKFSTYVVLVCIFFNLSCKVDFTCEWCINENKPHIVNAGADQQNSLPINSINLDGSLSADPDSVLSNQIY